MAYTDKVINGGDIILKVEGEIIACATSHTIEVSNAVREISCKGSGDWTSSEYGRFSWTGSTDALLNLGPNETINQYITYPELLALMIGKTVVAIESSYEDPTGDTMVVSGEAIITSISKTAGDNENASYSVSLQGRGELDIQASGADFSKVTLTEGGTTDADFFVIENNGRYLEYPEGKSEVVVYLAAGNYNILASASDGSISDSQAVTVAVGVDQTVTFALV